jgi:Cdc6-like AAA superfamily ATPase
MNYFAHSALWITSLTLHYTTKANKMIRILGLNISLSCKNQMYETFSIFKEFLPLLTAGGVAVSAAGLIPRIGLGRAIWIALRSRFAFKLVPESLRLAEINLLKRKIADKDFGQGYLVVTGEKGVGKTCLLNTVTSKTAGVIKVKAQPKDDENTIIKNTLLNLTNPQFKFMDPFKSALKVV